MKQNGLNVFLAVVVILGLFNLISPLFSSNSDSRRSGTRRSGSDYSSGRTYSGGSSSKTNATTPKATRAVPKATTPRSTKPSSASNDPFDAASYPHPDDFYYDHYHDFWDYEDAEEYWENHQ